MMKKVMAVSMFIFSIVSLTAYAEDAPRYEEGKHYTLLNTPLKTSYRGEEIGEIYEFFSFSCIHCYRLEPGVERFLQEKPDNVRFTQVPVVFNERQKPEARAYYVAKLLKLEEANKAIFDRNFVEKKYLRTDKAFAKFFTQFGVSEKDYMAKAYSFAVDSMVNNAIRMTGTSEISGTPAIIVNGKYQIDTGASGGNEAALYVAKWLVEHEAQAQK
jgi:thiol:disulfide interchange protein DsbA